MEKKWDVDVKSFSSPHIDAFISTNIGIIWRFTRFYGNPKRNQRKHSWELLNRLHDLFKLPWLVAGDFNEIIHLSEKLGGNDCIHADMNRFLETNCNTKFFHSKALSRKKKISISGLVVGTGRWAMEEAGILGEVENLLFGYFLCYSS